MLPVYRAISFQRIISKGGRTEPWVIVVRTEDSLRPFVVKVFETPLIETKDSVMSEVMGNVLAKQFALPVPKAALIEFDENFVSSIRDFQVLELLEQKDERLKFGSELLDGYVQFNPSIFNASEAMDIIQIDSVFAFDLLIRNGDRVLKKPNLLIKNDKGFLIDHELGFEITEKTTSENLSWQVPPKFWKYHLFHNLMHGSQKETKEDYFHEFQEHLRYLDIESLKPYFKQLSHSGFSSKKHNLIIQYLREMKSNSANFANLLKALI